MIHLTHSEIEQICQGCFHLLCLGKKHMNTPSLQKHGEGMRDCETLGGTANNFSEDLCVSFPKRRETESFHGKLPITCSVRQPSARTQLIRLPVLKELIFFSCFVGIVGLQLVFKKIELRDLFLCNQNLGTAFILKPFGFLFIQLISVSSFPFCIYSG